MKYRKLMRCAVLLALAAFMLVLPAAADEVTADYSLNVYAGAVEKGDTLVITSGDSVVTYTVSAEAVKGLDVTDTRSAAGDFNAVAGTEGMLLTVSDPACEGIRFEGSWNDDEAADVSVSFNGEEQVFTGESLELDCEIGKLTVGKDGSIAFAAEADADLVTLSQSKGEESCSVSLQRSVVKTIEDAVQKVYHKQVNFNKWIGVPLPKNTAVSTENLPWGNYIQFSVANGNLFGRQVKDYPFSATNPAGTVTGKFDLIHRSFISASADWAKDLGRSTRYVRLNGEGHGYNVSDTVEDGIFRLDYDRWYYTAADNDAGAFQFTSQMKGLELVAAVGRDELPEIAAVGGEMLVIESNGNSYTHSMQRLTEGEMVPEKVGKLTVHAYIVP